MGTKTTQNTKTLTSLAHAGGCSAKLGPADLNRILESVPSQDNSNLLAGFDGREDAAVYRVNSDTAFITTVDITTPLVDDPFLFGQISACNALSDVYAMGGKPITCLNVIGFPAHLEIEILEKIIAGACHKIKEAGALLVGGHTIKDNQPWFGLSVTGIVHPQKFWRNNTSQRGDVLILTKPIGCGVLFSVNKIIGLPEDALSECLRNTTMLNKTSSEIISDFKVNAVTDVTGFGLLGHSLEMSKGSNLSFIIEASKVPTITESLEWYEKGYTTSITPANMTYVKPHLISKKDLPDSLLHLFTDPQTNGGLLISLPAEIGEEALNALHQGGIVDARIIGEVKEFEGKHIIIR